MNNGLLTIIHNGTLVHTPVTDDSSPSPWSSIAAQVTKIIFDGPVVAPQNSLGFFDKFPNLTQIDGLGSLDTSNVTNMAFMFARSSKLKTVDLSRFNTSKVLKMASMFGGASSLTSLDLSGFDTSKVMDMNNMFADASALTSVKLAQSELITHNSTLYVGDQRNASDNFVSAKDRDGNSVDFSGVTSSGTVDTNTPGTYKITYTANGLPTTATVTVKAKTTSSIP